MRPFSQLVGLCLLILSALPAAAGPAWDPKQTHALIIGILEWRDKELTKFPKENRQDRALERALKTAGVPADQVEFIGDRHATLSAIRSAMDRVMARSGPDSTLLIYFTGHGMKEDGRTYLANYDVDSEHAKQTGLGVDEIGQRLARDWRGNRLLMLVDCCHSGAVSSVVTSLGAKGKVAACLTSATASNESTGNWTFTEAVIRAVQGQAGIDRNGDGRVTFDEVDTHVHDEMKYGEDQLTHAVRAGGFESDWQVARASGSRPVTTRIGRWAVGDYADAYSEGDWYRAKVLKVESNRLFLRYFGYDGDQDEWLPLSKVRPIPNSRFKKGQRVQVEWEGKWYAGTIVRSAENYFSYVSFDDFDDEDSEWVTDTRLKNAR